MALTVTTGCLTSSIKYNKRKEGKAKNNKVKAGRIVQTVSTS